MDREEFLKQYSAKDGKETIEVPEVVVTPEAQPSQVERDEFLDQFNRAATPGVKIPLTDYKYGPMEGAALRGAAGIPGAIPDVLNFITDIPGLSAKGLGWALDSEALSQTGDEMMGMVPEIPWGSDWWKDQLNAPKLGIDYQEDPGFPRYLQKGVELGVGSLGFGLGSLPERALKKDILPELLTPKTGTIGAQLSQDFTAGTTAGMGEEMGRQWGGEESGDSMGAWGGVIGGLAPMLTVKGARTASGILGVRDPSKFTDSPMMWAFDKMVAPGGEHEAQALLARNFDLQHPDARAQLLADLEYANARAGSRMPGVDFTTSMLTDNPALDVLTGPARRAAPTVFREAENKARGQVNEAWRAESPSGDPTFPRAFVQRRFDNTVESIADRRRAAELEAQQAADAVTGPAAANNAELAGGRKAQAVQELEAGVSAEADAAKSLFGQELERIKGSGFEIPGSALEDWRKRIVAAADAEGQKELLPDFLNVKVGGLNEELYPTSATGVVGAPGAKSRTVEVPAIDSLTNQPSLLHTKKVTEAVDPKNITLRKAIGWDQLLREEETKAYKAGEGRKAHWAKQARQELSALIESQLGAPEYAAAKKAYLDNVVSRFYTPTVDPILSPTGTAADTARTVLPQDVKGHQAVQEVLQAVGDNPQAGQAFVDFALSDFVATAYNPNTKKLDMTKANAWMKAHSGAVAALRSADQNGNALASQITQSIDDIMENQGALDSALSSALQREKAAGSRETKWTRSLANKSSARFFLGKDPEATVAELLNSKNLTEDAAAVGRLVGKDPDALKGLQQAVYDHLYRSASDIASAATTNNLQGISAQITDSLKAYQKLETAGILPKGTVTRARQLIAAEYSVLRSSKAKASGQDVRQISQAEKDISQISRGLAGSRAGNLTTALVRDLFKMGESELVQRVLREAALDPQKMMELLRAQSKSKTSLRNIFGRQAAMAMGDEEESDGR